MSEMKKRCGCSPNQICAKCAAPVAQEEGQRRIQAAAERRTKRNAKQANKGDGDE